MKKFLCLLLVLLFIIEFIFIIIARSIYITYHYPYNDFFKVEKTMSLSKNHKNVIYIMVDMTNGFDVTSILQSNLQLAKNFTGFTNYENVITNNWGTNASIPNIFGGYDYNTYHKNNDKKDITFKEYMKNAMNTLIDAFGNHNWDISCIGNQYYDYDENKSYWDSNWKTLENDFKKYNVQAINAADISRLLYYKYPQLYKKLKLPYKNFLYSSNSNYIPITTFLSHTKIENSNNSKFMTIMDESVHSSIVMDKFGNYKPSEDTINNIYNATIGFLKKIGDFINYLKNNNIYDNTMIIINSDHGNSIGSLPIADSNYNYSGIDYSAIINLEKKYKGFVRSFPTLLIKPFNENYDIRYDNNNLYTNADALSFIKKYNDEVDFEILDKTEDIRYLIELDDISISNRSNTYMPIYKNDTWWKDYYIHYCPPYDYNYLVKIIFMILKII